MRDIASDVPIPGVSKPRAFFRIVLSFAVLAPVVAGIVMALISHSDVIFLQGQLRSPDDILGRLSFLFLAFFFFGFVQGTATGVICAVWSAKFSRLPVYVPMAVAAMFATHAVRSGYLERETDYVVDLPTLTSIVFPYLLHVIPVLVVWMCLKKRAWI